MPHETRIKPVEAAARALHDWAREHDHERDDHEPPLEAWEDIPAEVRERYLDLARCAVKAWKKAKA